jgi:hypothetical protein
MQRYRKNPNYVEADIAICSSMEWLCLRFGCLSGSFLPRTSFGMKSIRKLALVRINYSHWS